MVMCSYFSRGTKEQVPVPHIPTNPTELAVVNQLIVLKGWVNTLRDGWRNSREEVRQPSDHDQQVCPFLGQGSKRAPHLW
jgi:hypothetical protein